MTLILFVKQEKLTPVPDGQYQDGQNTDQNLLHCVLSSEDASYKNL